MRVLKLSLLLATYSPSASDLENKVLTEMPFSSWISEQQSTLRGEHLTLKQTSEIEVWFITPLGELRNTNASFNLKSNSQEPSLNNRYHYDKGHIPCHVEKTLQILFLDWWHSFFRASLVAQLVKNLPTMWETWAQSLGLGRSPGGGHGNPSQYSCLENPQGQRSLVGYSPWGLRVRHDWVTKRSTGF